MRALALGLAGFACAILILASSLVPALSLQPDALSLPSQEEMPLRGGILHESTPSDPTSLNGLLSITDTDYTMWMYEGLVSFRYDQNGRWYPTPSLARSWNISSDGLTYTFHLRNNLTWSDGYPLTSADVKYSFETNVKYGPRGKANFGRLNQIEAPDNYTVVFMLNSTSGPLATLWPFSVYQGSIIPKHIYEGTDILNNPYNMKPVTSGPFRFKEYVKGSYVELERNPYYWQKDQWGNQLPYLDGVVIHIVPSDAIRVAGLEKGDYQYDSAPPTRDFAAMLASYNATIGGVQDVPEYASQDAIMFNLRRTITGDLRVRQAIAHVIEKYKDVMLSDARFGMGFKSYTAIAPRGAPSWAYADPFVDKEVPLYDANITEANRLLDAAGYHKGSDGKRFTLTYWVCTCRPEEVSMGQILKQALLSDVGIDLDIRTADNPTWVSKTFMDWDFDLSIRTLSTGPDPNTIYPYYDASQIRHAAFTNAMGYNNSYVSGLIEQAAQLTSLTERKAMYRQIQIQLLKDLPATWILVLSEGRVWNRDFVGPGYWLGMPNEGWMLYHDGDRSHIWWKRGEPIGVMSTITTAPTSTTAAAPISPEYYAATLAVILILAAVAFLIHRRKRATN